MTQTVNLSNGETKVCHLYVTRDNTTCGNGQWWCVWAVPGESCFVGAEGYCSRRMHRTRRGAAAYGERMFGEVPTYWPPSATEAPTPRRVRDAEQRRRTADNVSMLGLWR